MFNLELDRIALEIQRRKAKHVLLQIPDGMKKNANAIVQGLEEKTGATVYIWFSSCFGQCDFPLGLGPLGIDLMISYGHNRYNKTEQW